MVVETLLIFRVNDVSELRFCVVGSATVVRPSLLNVLVYEPKLVT